MSEDMVERLAHRLYDALRPESAPPYWLCERAARAAIEAMREPNIAMVGAAVAAAERSGSGDFVAIFRAMIDAALNQKGVEG